VRRAATIFTMNAEFESVKENNAFGWLNPRAGTSNWVGILRRRQEAGFVQRRSSFLHSPLPFDHPSAVQFIKQVPVFTAR